MIALLISIAVLSVIIIAGAIIFFNSPEYKMQQAYMDRLNSKPKAGKTKRK